MVQRGWSRVSTPLFPVFAVMLAVIPTRAGDGTTTSTLLTQEIVNQGMRLVTAGANPVELRQGILAASKMIIEEIKKEAVPVAKNEVWSALPFELRVTCAVERKDDAVGM